jgi:plastocyanin
VKGKAAITLLVVAAIAGPGAADAAAQAAATVNAAGGNTWSPNNPTVAVGGVVTFNNATGVVHNVVVAGTPIQGNAASFSAAYTAPATPGAVPFVCTIHPGTMTGTINVVAAPAAPAPTPTPAPAPTPITPAAPVTPATDSTAPRATRVLASGTLTRATVKLRLDEAATVTARLTRSGARTTLKRVTRKFTAGSRQITLSRTLSNGKRYRIALRIVDAAGNVATRTVSFTARR